LYWQDYSCECQCEQSAPPAKLLQVFNHRFFFSNAFYCEPKRLAEVSSTSYHLFFTFNAKALMPEMV
jgi:hypothetical protein